MSAVIALLQYIPSIMAELKEDSAIGSAILDVSEMISNFIILMNVNVHSSRY